MGEERYFLCGGVWEDEDAGSWCTSIECSLSQLRVRTLQGLVGVRCGGGAAFWLAKCLFAATGGTEMIGARVWVANDRGSFTVMVCAESLRQVEQTAKARYPGSTVRIAFPIEPEWFFAGAPHTGARAGLETMEGLTDPIRPS
jgi:hypothetical protein